LLRQRPTDILTDILKPPCNWNGTGVPFRCTTDDLAPRNEAKGRCQDSCPPTSVFAVRAIREKADKYAQACTEACWLVLYLNIVERCIRQNETEQVIAGALLKYRDRFQTSQATLEEARDPQGEDGDGKD
jgi:hypothetical protein